ncbi:MAG: PKD domain-containing protein [Saprospiraceae bacterium]
MRFAMEYAYVRYSDFLEDQLIVRISTDGGNTFPTTLFTGDENGSGNFATGFNNTNPFTPASADDWCGAGPACIALDLSAYDGMNDIVIRIENINGYGNWMYVDNISLSASCGATEPPVAAFSADPTIGCAPLLVEFTDESTGLVAFREWIFEGGSPEFSEEANPLVDYFDPGEYEVMLTVENNAGSDTHTETTFITVLGLPFADFSFTATGMTYQFTNLSQNEDDLEWSFGDGNTSTQENPSHTYSEPGTYTVTLDVFNECGTESYQETIVVEADLIAEFTSDVTTGCTSLVVNFEDVSIGLPIAWEWTFEGGNPATSSLANPVVTYNTPGSYDVTLVVDNGTSVQTITLEDYIVVNSEPTVYFTTTVTPGSGIIATDNNSSNADSYIWDFGDGSTSNELQPIHTYTAEGTYTVSLTAENECGEVTMTQEVMIVFPPEATFTASTTAGCAPLAVDFMASPQGAGYTYEWSFPGGMPTTSDDANPTVTYTTEGVYDVTLTVTNAGGSSTISQTSFVQVDGAIIALFDAIATPVA